MACFICLITSHVHLIRVNYVEIVFYKFCKTASETDICDKQIVNLVPCKLIL